jgi:predicted HTH transcriptional regulator
VNFRILETENDLMGLVANKIQEDLHLDYKQCPALCRMDAKAAEATKDVSSFANSDGGQIVYGIIEDKHFPVDIDSGFDPSEISKEWLEDILTSGIRPRIPDLSIKQITLQSTGSNRVAYVVDIPKSYSGPHQDITGGSLSKRRQWRIMK